MIKEMEDNSENHTNIQQDETIVMQKNTETTPKRETKFNAVQALKKKEKEKKKAEEKEKKKKAEEKEKKKKAEEKECMNSEQNTDRGQQNAQINSPLLLKLQEKQVNFEKVLSYFITNAFESSFIDKTKIILEQITKAIRLVNQGKDNEDNSSLISLTITASFITGYSENERTEKYNEIINHFETEVKTIQQSIDSIKKYFANQKKVIITKYMSRRNQSILNEKEEKEKELKEFSEKKKPLDQIIAKLKEDMTNPLIPVPLYKLITEEEKKEKIDNEDIEQNTISIHLGNFDYHEHFIYAEITLNNNVQIAKPETIDYFNKTIRMHFDQSTFRQLHTRKLKIEIYKSTFFCCGNELKGTGEIKLDQLANKSEINIECYIDLESKIMTPKLNVTLKVCSPLVKKEYITVSKKVIKILRKYPEFKMSTITDCNANTNNCMINNPNQNNHLRSSQEGIIVLNDNRPLNP